jgi:methylmalonyl-CoA mutase cobalamin-binding subunit
MNLLYRKSIKTKNAGQACHGVRTHIIINYLQSSGSRVFFVFQYSADS